MDLKKLIIESQDGFNSITDPTFLFSLSKFEQYVKESYEGRLFFELIQNARDAAFSGRIESDISIIVTAEKVLFANTGKPFDEKGVLAMTRLGLSSKDDNELIGSKGIGFKAIQEYSRTPKIITEFGTFYFDKDLVKKVLDQRFPDTFKDSSVPLFYYPHYEETTCSQVSELQDRSYDTIIEFALNKGKAWNIIVALFNKITDEELILLGSINSISFKSPHLIKNRLFKNTDGGYIECHNGTAVKKFKVFQPESAVIIPEAVFDVLDEAEKKTYETDRKVEIKLVFECRADEKIIPKTNSKLFLYYPLEITTGFPYIIHSNFSCNPERTSIRGTRLNEFLFDQISTMQTGQILDHLLEQDYKIKLLDYLYFERKDEKLNVLYKLYASKLRSKKIIWIENIQHYAAPDEIIYCPRDIYAILKTHTIEGRHLFACDEKIKEFLVENFKIKTLSNSDVLKYIEEIAEKEVQNAAFFEKLYAFLIRNNLHIYEKKILLGSNNLLYGKKDDVFYVPGRTQISIPDDISDQLILLHPEIRIKTEDAVKSTRIIGIREYRSADLVDKALTLLSNELVDNYSILEFLIGLESLAQNSKDSIYRKIIVPVKGKKEWLMPVHNPVYFESEDILELYPEGNYIDLDSCIARIISADREKIISFFKEYGIWDVPALFFSEHTIDTTADQQRTKKINSKTGKNAYGYHIKNDRLLDFPKKSNYFFFNSIYSNWTLYEEKIAGKTVLEFTAKSTVATNTDSFANCTAVTGFIKTLQEEAWIFLSQDRNTAFSTGDVAGLNKLDAITDKILLARLDILVMDYDKNRSFFDLLGIDHFNTFSNLQIVSILNKTAEKYLDKEGDVLDADFKRFYHAILKYLYNTYVQSDTAKRDSLVRLLGSTLFLCKKLQGPSELISWKEPKLIYHIDERVVFDNLPYEAKELFGCYFTKSDKNEIGRIFSRIGIKTSSEIVEMLELPDRYNESGLIDKVINMPYIIKAVEDAFGNLLPEKAFSWIRELKLLVCSEDLVKEVTLNSKPHFRTSLELKYFFDKEKNSVLISKKHLPVLEHKNLLSEILNTVFSYYLDKELWISRLIKDLLYSRNTKTFSEALEYIDYDKERISEIEIILNENTKTPEQEFWSAVLYAKDADDSEGISIGITNENFEGLTENLSSGKAVIQKWFEQINYLNLNDPANLELFREIADSEAVSFEDVNQRLPKTISFGYLWARDFTAFKNKNLMSIKWQLFKYFENQGIEMRMKFHNAHIEIEKLELESQMHDHWEFNAAEHLAEVLNSRYNNFGLRIEEMQNQQNSELWKSLAGATERRKKHFSSLLKSDGLPLTEFGTFIAREEYFSLLYFEEYEVLKNSYTAIYPKTAQEDSGYQQLKAFELFPSAEEDSFEIVDCIIEEKAQNGVDVMDQVNQKLDNHRSQKGGGWSGRVILPNQKYLNHIGQQGEKLLFSKLSLLYNGNVTWVSENAVAGGFVPDRQAVGYDMRYIDENNQTHYVEVKTSTGEEPEFHISINEIRSARRHGAYYHVIWITNVFETRKRQYLDLKNMFIDFNPGEDFFHNSKFYPELTGFKIVFKPHPDAFQAAISEVFVETQSDTE